MKLKLLSKMRKVISVIALLCLGVISSQAQTTLAAGDIMFVGVNSDATGTPSADEFVVLFLEPVTTGTVIYFTDMGYTGNSAPYFQQNPNNGCGGGTGAVSDGLIRWTASGAVTAGTQLVIRVNPASGSITASTGSLAIEVETSSAGQGMNLSAAGEAIHAFQGTLNGSSQVTSATMLASLDYDALWTGTVTTCQFSSTVSEDPGTGYEVELSSHDDNAYYSGTQSGDKATLQAAILNIGNWTQNSVTGYTFPISGTFTVGSNTTWNGSTWSNGAPSSTVDAIIASSTTPGAFTCKDLTINSSFALTLGGGVTATIHGDMTNSGNGISGAGNLTFAKSGAASLSGTAFSVAGVVTVNSGCTLTTNDKLTLSSDASNTGSIGNSAGTISGNVTIERYIPGKRAFRFLGHPFTTAQALSTLTDDIDITGNSGATNGFTTTGTNNPSAFWYDVSAGNGSGSNDPGWTAFTHTNGVSANSWDQYEMIRVLVRGAKTEGLTGGSYTPSATTLDMTGTVNQGTQVVSVTKGSGTIYAGVANPFPSGVQMNAVTRGGGIATFYYIWNATSGAAGAYEAKLYSSSYILPSGASHITALASAGTLTFPESCKAAGGAGIFKGTGQPEPQVQLIISDSSTLKWDELLIVFDDTASTMAENLIDAKKFYNPGLDFFTLSTDNERLAMDVRPYEDTKSIELGLTAYNRYNRYVIKTGDFNPLPGTKLYLHDKYLNKKEELKAGFEYVFDVTTDTLSQGNQRFEINMVGKPTGIAETNANTAKMRLFPNPAQNDVKVAFDNLDGTAQVKLVSITGQVIFSQAIEASTGSIIIPLQNVPSGIYIVNLQSKNARFTQKLIKE